VEPQIGIGFRRKVRNREGGRGSCLRARSRCLTNKANVAEWNDARIERVVIRRITGIEMAKSNEEMLSEALALIKALAPKEAPNDLFCIKGATGLNIMKNDMMPENTIMVSKRLFDLIYETAQPYN